MRFHMHVSYFMQGVWRRKESLLYVTIQVYNLVKKKFQSAKKCVNI